MNRDILVSIICLAYNHEKFIKECIEGFVMQKTNFAFEVLIHDDASTDNTANIIKEYQIKYPDIIYPILQTENQYSKKIPIGKTFLYPKARGKYIALCEGDDYWTDLYKLQKQVDFLENNPDYVLSHTSFNFQIEYENNRIVITDDISKNNNEILTTDAGNIISHILNYNKYRIQTATAIFRKDVYDKIENDKIKQSQPLFLMGDTPLWVRLCQYGKIHFLNESTTVYRQHQGSACREISPINRLRFVLSCSEMRVYFANLYGIPLQYKDKFESAYKKDLFKYMLYNNTYIPIFKPYNSIFEKYILYDLILSKPILYVIKQLYNLYKSKLIIKVKNQIKKILY